MLSKKHPAGINKYHVFILPALSIFLLPACSKKSDTVITPAPAATVAMVTTIAGTGTAGNANGAGTAAAFYFPSAVAFSNSGTLYIGDFGNNTIRTLNTTGNITALFAGTGAAGLVNGPVATAKFNGPANIAFDAGGNLFVADESNNVIREISAAGNVTTVAGTGVSGYQDGAGSTAKFNHPEGIVIDATGNLFVADGQNHVIRKIILSTGVVSTYSGTAGSPGFTNGPVSTATFNDPYGLTLDASGNIYVADIQNNCIRKITVSTGTVSTFAGSGVQGLSNGPAASAKFYYPLGSAFDAAGNLYVADTYNHVIRKVATDGTVSTVAGTGTAGATDGVASSATFNFPIGVTVRGNIVYVADTHNNDIRAITF